jgi:hypothetical protein
MVVGGEKECLSFQSVNGLELLWVDSYYLQALLFLLV